MNWTEILICFIGSSALTTLITVFANKKERNAKAESIEVTNLTAMINTLADRMTKMEEKADADRAEAHRYVKELRDEILGLRSKVNTLERVTTQAYRCRYPENILDCPVVKAYEEHHCGLCEHDVCPHTEENNE